MGHLDRPFGPGRLGRHHFGERDRPIVDAVGAVAAAKGVTRAQVSLAWLLAQPAVAAPIVGATKAEHVVDVAGATEIELTESDIRTLEAPYTPREVLGY